MRRYALYRVPVLVHDMCSDQCALRWVFVGWSWAGFMSSAQLDSSQVLFYDPFSVLPLPFDRNHRLFQSTFGHTFSFSCCCGLISFPDSATAAAFTIILFKWLIFPPASLTSGTTPEDEIPLSSLALPCIVGYCDAQLYSLMTSMLSALWLTAYQTFSAASWDIVAHLLMSVEVIIRSAPPYFSVFRAPWFLSSVGEELCFLAWSEDNITPSRIFTYAS